MESALDSRGSPFQLPARLADGLGPGSDLEFSYRNSFAPSRPQPFCALRMEVLGSHFDWLSSNREFGSPALARRKAGQLRLQLCLRSTC